MRVNPRPTETRPSAPRSVVRPPLSWPLLRRSPPRGSWALGEQRCSECIAGCLLTVANPSRLGNFHLANCALGLRRVKVCRFGSEREGRRLFLRPPKAGLRSARIYDQRRFVSDWGPAPFGLGCQPQRHRQATGPDWTYWQVKRSPEPSRKRRRMQHR